MTPTSPLTLPLLIPGESELDAKFYAWLGQNPDVYDEIVSMARMMKAAKEARGVTDVRLGMKQIFEVLRWNRDLSSPDGTGFKMNNSYTSRMALVVMDREPDLRGVFETRRLTSERAA